MTVYDPAQVRARLGRPVQARLDQIHAAYAEATTPSTGEALWARLIEAAIVPGDFVSNQGRCYGVINTESHQPDPTKLYKGCHPRPSTVDSVVTFGSDIDGMRAAEKALRHAVEALMPWGAVAARRVEWYCLSHRRPLLSHLGFPHECALDSLEYVLEGGVDWATLAEPEQGIPPLVLQHLRGARGWAIAAREKLEVPKACGAPRSIIGQSFAELSDPFTPLLDFWLSGYHLVTLPSADDPIARIHAFAWDAPIAPAFRAVLSR